MDGLQTLDLVLFAAATFAAAFVAGLAGFAFGIVAAAVWLHFLGPAPAAALIVAFGLIVQVSAVWKLRRAIKLARLPPFLIGADTLGLFLIGLPPLAAGTWLGLKLFGTLGEAGFPPGRAGAAGVGGEPPRSRAVEARAINGGQRQMEGDRPCPRFAR